MGGQIWPTGQSFTPMLYSTGMKSHTSQSKELYRSAFNLAIVYSLRGGIQLNKFNTVTHQLPANNQHFVAPPTCLEEGGVVVKRHGGHCAGVTKLKYQ